MIKIALIRQFGVKKYGPRVAVPFFLCALKCPKYVHGRIFNYDKFGIKSQKKNFVNVPTFCPIVYPQITGKPVKTFTKFFLVI